MSHLKPLNINWNLLYGDREERKKRNRFYVGNRYDDDSAQLKKLAEKLPSIKVKQKSDFSRTALVFGTRYSHEFAEQDFSSKVFENEKKQRVMIKMRYSDKMRTHQKFLNHYMVQENKDDVLVKPKLFGNITSEEYSKKMTDRHFKFIISPERSDIDLEKFAVCWMDYLEKTLLKKFDWQAVVHTDTSHPHLHIVINGKDQNGKKLVRPFPKHFMQKGIIRDTSNLLTRILGERTTEEIFVSRDASVEALRWTGYDEEIKENLYGCKIIGKEWFSGRVSKRLSYLEKIGLVEFVNGNYVFQDNWEESLRAAGRYNSYLQSAEELKWTVPKDYSLYDNEDEITGEIRKVYSMNDEDIWNNAVVIENRELRKAWYVPLFNPADKFSHHIGEEVRIKKIKNSKGLFEPEITLKNEKKTSRQNQRPPDGGVRKSVKFEDMELIL